VNRTDDPLPRALTAEARVVLSLEGVEAAYDGIIIALRGVSLRVRAGEVVALLGANGAGKSTTLKAISGLLGAQRGGITAGTITVSLDGDEGGGAIALGPGRRHQPGALARAGLVQVLEGRRCFPHFTVEENLLAGALGRGTRGRARRRDLERIYDSLPRLARIRGVVTGFTSGGEQQMVAIGRALMARPRVVLLDEPSMGLAPQMTDEIFRIVRRLNQTEGITFLLAEQNARIALRHADHGYVLENGRVVADGTADELARRDDVREFYLGSGGGRLQALRSRLRGTGPGHRSHQGDGGAESAASPA